MRRVAALVFVCTAIMMPAAADTDEQLNVWQPVTFTAPVPCSMVCPYWLDTANHDADGDGAEEIAFSACGNPGGTGGSADAIPGAYQEGTIYDDVTVGPGPDEATVLIFESFPAVDWDTFICSIEGVELAAGSNHLNPDTCTDPLGPYSPIPTGCSEQAVINVRTEGSSYILRAYNWSDVMPLEGRFCFSDTGSCEDVS